MNQPANQTSQALAINCLRKHRDRLLTKIDRKELRYADLDRESSRIANGIRSLGYGINDRISVILPNSIEYATAYLGIIKSGAALVPSNMMVGERDIAYILKDAQVKMMFVHATLLDKVLAMKPDLPLLKHVVVIGASGGNGVTGWDEFKAAYHDTPVEPNASPDEEALIVYTGGTTGHPKGVVHSQAGLFFDIIAHDIELPLTGQDKILIVTPMSHASGWIFFCGCVKGASFVIEKSFDPFHVLAVIEKEGVTMTMMVPTIIYVFLDILKQKPYDISSLKIIGYGAAPISEIRLAEALKRFGPIFYQKYGLVECPNMITTLTVDDHLKALQRPAILQSCGRPDVMVSVKIVDESDNELPLGQIGEIIVNCPYLMKGYLNQPEMTAATLKGGWLHTGDMGRLDDEGYLYIVDRKKDMIISGGMNVFPAEVEEVIRKHPKVKDVSVIGIPDEKWGEAVTACVVADGELSQDEIKSYCRGKLAKYAQPKSVVFKEQLPKTIIGKIDKKALREPYWQNKTRQVN